jgi:aspartyl/asparaginyl-tRNA synthetase
MYIANPDHTLGYAGNKIFGPLKRISNEIPAETFQRRTSELKQDEMWQHVARINHTINMAANEYFDSQGSLFALLPLTTRMISSPGALYGKERLDYTSDTVPVRLKWFGLKNEVFLAESAQIYLELYLMSKGVKSVYSIYNSFRKEPSDATHLSEFHHIEYEGKVPQRKNKEIVLNLLGAITGRLLKQNSDDLSFFLFDNDIEDLKTFRSRKAGTEITFEQALDVLHKTTNESKYKQFSTKHFGSWEEVKLTSEIDDMAIVTHFPLYEVAFYHAPLQEKGREVAENADFVWPYYREIAGSGHRVRSLDELLVKAKRFNLPQQDYKPYIESRSSSRYEETSGFGVGWERMLQGLLRTPYIYSASAFPRVHSTMYP